MPRSRSKQRAERPDPRKRRAWRDGHRGEFWAALFLRAKLYAILETRFRTPSGEIDIIARRFGVTVFVEVKARAFSSDELSAWDAVNTGRILAAADHYIARHPAIAETNMRFDVIFLAPFAWPRHVTNAFDASR
jgi:putative endonuclease